MSYFQIFILTYLIGREKEKYRCMEVQPQMPTKPATETSQSSELRTQSDCLRQMLKIQ